MKRDEWEFPCLADKLLKAAREKEGFHSGRVGFWEEKKEGTVQRIKDEGIEVDESLSDVLSNNYARNPAVNVRTDLVRDLQECVTKVREHRGKMDQYRAWIQVLESQGQTSLPLHHDDWLFFFGK